MNSVGGVEVFECFQKMRFGIMPKKCGEICLVLKLQQHRSKLTGLQIKSYKQKGTIPFLVWVVTPTVGSEKTSVSPRIESSQSRKKKVV